MEMILETRPLGEHDGFTLIAHKLKDNESVPANLGETEDAVIAGWELGHWRYVGVCVRAFKQDVLVAEQTLWSREDGSVGAVEVDAFDHTLPTLTKSTLRLARKNLLRVYDEPGKQISDLA